MSRQSPPAVFPIFYALLLAYTMITVFLAFASAPPPAASAGLPGPVNENAYWWTLLLFLISVSTYSFLNYVDLEIYEKEEHPLSTSAWRNWVDLLIRFSLLTIVAMKIFKYHYLNEAFLFVATVSIGFFVWYLYRTIFLQQKHVATTLLHLFYASLSGAGLYFSRTGEGQKDFAVPILLAAVGIIVLTLLLAWGKLGKIIHSFRNDLHPRGIDTVQKTTGETQ